MGVVLSLSLGSWRLWNKDGEIPELKNHWIYWNCPALSYSQNRGSGERGLGPPALPGVLGRSYRPPGCVGAAGTPRPGPS